MGLATFEDPGKHETKGFQITAGHDWLPLPDNPAVAHQIPALPQIRGMAEPERVANLMLRDISDRKGRNLNTQWRRIIRFDEDILTLVVATDCHAIPLVPPSSRYVMDDYVGSSVSAGIRAGDIGERNPPVEAVIKKRAPPCDGGVDGIDIRWFCIRVSMNGSRQIRMIPPVSPSVIAHDLDRRGIGFG